MIYKFKSKAGGDVIMLGPNGDRLLGLIGKPVAAKGILEPADLPAAIAALQAAVDADEAARGGGAPAHSNPNSAEPVSLRQRVWPLVELMKRAQAAGEPIVWGV